MSRGNNRREIFRDAADHDAFLTATASVGARYSWQALSYCLMPNHFHLLIRAPVHALSSGMQDLLGGYARRFNRRHGVSGHVFGGRFRSVDVLDDRQVAAVVRYIALNPVEAGLCATPEDWPWGSFGAATASRPPHPCLARDALWETVATDAPSAIALLRTLVTPVPGT